ncbi:MAG TPA: pseudouridine synthase [Methanoculleus sp.]|nr:pseudouridine synthase [Methanoculleus sp.]
MSFFEAKKRDICARIGVFDHGGTKLSSPAAVDAETIFPELGTVRHTNVPLAAGERFTSEYLHRYRDLVAGHPHSDAAAPPGACIVVENWHTVMDNPSAFVDMLANLKRRHPPDTLWYAPAAALPSTVAVLVYAGFDLFDFKGVDLKTAQGYFCTPEGEFSADEWMDAGTCSCAGCRSGNLGEHNRTALREEIALATKMIARGTLREFIEGRCRNRAAFVAVLRLFDGRYEYLEPRAPVAREGALLAASGESLRRPEVVRFGERVVDRFVPTRTDVAVLLPCSAKKPYSMSQSHHKFQNAIRNRGHELILTSPLGLVPRELEAVYPAAHYDVPVSGYWDREEQCIIASVLARYLARHGYARVIAHLEGGSMEIARAAAARAGIELEETCSGRPTDPAALERLEEALDGARAIRPDTIKGTVSWQFGIDIPTGDLQVRGKPWRRLVVRGREQVFSIDAATGLFRPTFAGWQLLGDCYRVAIDDFIPQGDILAPGVIGADDAIREGDEVFVVGRRAVATGRAAMGADEMRGSSRGVAVKVRKVQKRTVDD